MNYSDITKNKLILSKIEFIPSKQGGYYMQEYEVCKLDFDAKNNEQQKRIIKNVLSWLDCESENKIINKILKDIQKNEYCIFKQEKRGLKTELLKTFSLKIEKTINKQFTLI